MGHLIGRYGHRPAAMANSKSDSNPWCSGLKKGANFDKTLSFTALRCFFTRIAPILDIVTPRALDQIK